jgi:tetratricopeptide (TPR) repeat protein
VLAASSIGLSRVLEAEVPSAALALNPLNADALINRITAELNDPDNLPDLDALAIQARNALRFDAGDARLYSLIGEIEFRKGDKDLAFQLFDQALKLSKTEIHALQRSIDRSIEAGDLSKAVDEIDILLRRWPDRFSTVANGFPVILSNPDGYQAVLKAVSSGAPWRHDLFSALVADPEGLDLANQLLLDLAASGAPPKVQEVSSVIRGYLKQNKYDAAYRLFLFSLTDEEKKLGGYVFNGTFEPIYSNRVFDWQIPNQSGLDLTFSTSHQAVEGEEGATVRFLNAPVKNLTLYQYTELPPGPYRLSLLASGRNLKLPKGFFWSLRCLNAPDNIGRLDIPEGTFNRQNVSQDIVVPPSGCPLQLLRLEAGGIAESWRFRYTGTLVMHKLSIERVSS